MERGIHEPGDSGAEVHRGSRSQVVEAARVEDHLGDEAAAHREWERADFHYRTAMSHWFDAVGDVDADFLATACKLVQVAIRSGDQAAAERMFMKNIGHAGRVLTPDHPLQGQILADYADFNARLGRWALAVGAYQQAIESTEMPVERAKLQISLAIVLADPRNTGYSDIDEAQRLVAAARPVLVEKGLGDSDAMAEALNAVGVNAGNHEDWETARRYVSDAFSIRRRLHTANDWRIGNSLHNLAWIGYHQNQLDEAERHGTAALEIARRGTDREHTAHVAGVLGLIHAARSTAQGDRMALELLVEAADLEEQLIYEAAQTGSDTRTIQMLDRARLTSLVYLVALAKRDPSRPAVESAFARVLRRKGLSIDAIRAKRYYAAAQIEDPEIEQLRQHKQEVTDELNEYISSRPRSLLQTDQRFLQLWFLRENLETDIAITTAHRIGPFPLESPSVPGLMAQLEPGTAYLDIVIVAESDLVGRSLQGTFRYVGFLARAGGSIRLIDIGDAEEIDTLVRQYRTRVRRRDGYLEPGRALAACLVEPVLEDIADIIHLIVSPAGMLTRLPIGALPIADGYLLDQMLITCQTSARELMRASQATHAGGWDGSVVIGDPDYDMMDGGTDASDPRQLPGWPKQPWRRLRHTRAEAIQVAEMLGTEPVLARDATKDALRSVANPPVLHIASHAQVDPDSTASWIRDAAIVLAGVNRASFGMPHSDAGDGLLSAMEVAGLDLHDTELVFLSACSSGTGLLRDGEGAFGLRRAIAAAGARSIVSTLWPVTESDATVSIVTDFYKAMLAGEPRGEALRRAQITAREKYAEPLVWAPFVLHGASGPLARHP